jgi:NAD(P)-dependent dehydrogenase (short-subunit alcohol dehydrogenase family)
MKNIIITGSSNGFGLKAAKDFADKGNKVYATMRNPNGKNANAKADLESHSTNIKVVDMDVTDEASVKEAMATILAEAGSVDVLINNAGIMYLGITEAFSVEQAKFQMETNYFGAIRVMQAVLPSMRKAGSGLIINTSSLVGRMSPPFFGTYTATKHALEGYTQALRYEVSQRLAKISCGLTRTESASTVTKFTKTDFGMNAENRMNFRFCACCTTLLIIQK